MKEQHSKQSTLPEQPSRETRLGTIIQIVAGHPLIKLSGLRHELKRRGIQVSERTVAKDVLALKNDFRLLNPNGRLRRGYELTDIHSFSAEELNLIRDLVYAFSVRFADPEAKALLGRLNFSASRSRGLVNRDIYKHDQKTEGIQRILLAAIRNREAVEMVYRTPRLKDAQRVRGYPLLALMHDRGWYFIVRDVENDSYRPRRLDRIHSCKVLTSLDTNPRHDENLVEAEFLVSTGWGMRFPQTMNELEAAQRLEPIVVRFDRTVAPFILESTARHPRCTISACKDGTGEALMKVRLADPIEFIYWVRSFGSKAWIVSPVDLVRREKMEATRMLRRYQQ